MRVPKMGEKILIEIDDIKFYVSLLTLQQKEEILGCEEIKGGVVYTDTFKQLYLTMKYSLKDVKGLENENNSDYKLEFEEGGALTENCTNEIISLDIKNIGYVFSKLNRGIPNKILDPATGKALDGVKIHSGEKPLKKSKRK